jgi:hypothetical protein
MSVAEADILTDAITQRVTAALSVPTATLAREWQVKLLAHSRGSEPDGLWVQTPAVPQRELEALVAAHTPVEVAFTNGPVKAKFRSIIAKRDKHFWLTDQFMFDALLLESVSELSAEARQTSTRLLVSAGTRVFAQVFPIVPGPQGQKLGPPINAKLWDLSPDDATFIHPFDKAVRAVPEGQPLRIIIHYFGGKLAVAAKLTFNETVSTKIIKFGARFDPPIATLGEEVIKPFNGVLATLKRHNELRSLSQRR